jgi:hypothetical protein
MAYFARTKSAGQLRIQTAFFWKYTARMRAVRQQERRRLRSETFVLGDKIQDHPPVLHPNSV